MKKTDCLILLVGSNPLPNYVAAKMLLSEGGRVAFVHSTDTAGIATKLAEVLKLGSEKIRRFEIKDLSCSSEIQGAVNKSSEWLGNENGKLHLHYTGGTKQMAVHSYQALKGSGKDFVASYLDARELKLRIDGEDRGYEINEELGLMDLMALHAMTLKDACKEKPVLKEEVVMGLMKFYDSFDSKSSQVAGYDQWLVRTIRSQDPNSPALCQEICQKKKKKGELVFKDSESLKKLVFDCSFSLDGDGVKSVPFGCPKVNPNEPTLAQLVYDGSDLKKACKALSGQWLEEYAFWCVEKVSSCVGLHEWHLSVKSQEGEIDKNEKFELDVVAIRKHQVFVISCTTASDKAMCKSKLFEVHLRARQIGGDEARTILLCLSERPDVLQKELDGPMEKHIKVFGRQDLKELPKKLCEWMKEQSAQEKACNWNPETQTCN